MERTAERVEGNDLNEWIELASLLGLRTIKSPDGEEIILFRHGNLYGGIVQVKATTITYITTDGRGMDHREEVTPIKAVIILAKMTKTYQCEVCTVYVSGGETHTH